MKYLSGFKFRLPVVLISVFTAMTILNGCQKTYTDMSNTGGNNDGGGAAGPGANEVFIQGFAFTPSTITVTVNTTITWTNKDTAPHTVTADGGAFTSVAFGINGTYSFKFTTAGTYPYHCAIHPAMTGTVIVN